MSWSAPQISDIVLAAVVSYFCVQGMRKGAIRAGIELFGFILSLAAATLLYAPVGQALFALGIAPSRSFAKAVGFVVPWLVVAAAYAPASQAFLERLPKKKRNRRRGPALGAAVGAVNGVFVYAFVVSFILSAPVSPSIKRAVLVSASGPAAVAGTESLTRVMDAALGGAFRETLTFTTVLQGSHDTVDLGFATDDFSIDAGDEARILALLNAERVRKNLAPLATDPAITATARAHAADMVKRGYFSHVNPDGKDPEARAAAGGVTFLAFSENIAYAPDASIAHAGFMNSPAHRANVLSTVFHRVGIGVADAGPYGIVVAQGFAE